MCPDVGYRATNLELGNGFCKNFILGNFGKKKLSAHSSLELNQPVTDILNEICVRLCYAYQVSEASCWTDFDNMWY